MPTADSSASKEVVTAALLVIGKIRSGRTKDQNVGYIAENLTAVGIDLKEVRWSAMRRQRSSTQLTSSTSLHLCLHHRRDRADPR
jgi:hypothetical protein